MGIGESNHPDRDEVSWGCSIVGLIAKSKGIRSYTKEDNRKKKLSPHTKTRPACPLMAMIMAR